MLEVEAQPKILKNLLARVEKQCEREELESLMVTSILLLSELHVLQKFSTPKLNHKEANHFNG